MEFAIHYQALIRNRELEVVRYDTCHDRLHVHRMWLDAPNDRLDLEPGASADYTAQFELAKRDILTHWRAYRAKMELME